MGKVLIFIGIVIMIIYTYYVYTYQIGIEVPSTINNTKYEFFYRIGYMAENGSKWLSLFTMYIPSIFISVGIVNIKFKKELYNE